MGSAEENKIIQMYEVDCLSQREIIQKTGKSSCFTNKILRGRKSVSESRKVRYKMGLTKISEETRLKLSENGKNHAREPERYGQNPKEPFVIS